MADTQVIRGKVSRRRLMAVVGGVMLGMLISSLQQTIIATAMPRIIAELNGMEQYAWAFTSFMLASTVMVPIWGKLSDLYGRRPFYILGLGLFILGSTLCGVAQDFTQLIIFRAIQGLGAGAMMPIMQAIIGDVFTPVERGKWQGAIMAVFGLSSIVGPVTGGWITDNWGWRWVFFVNLPLGLLALVAAGIALPKFQSRPARHRIDYLGSLLLIMGSVPMLLAFSWAGGQYAWGSPQIIGLLGFSVLVTGAFLLVEHRATEPVIAPSLFRNSIYSISVVTTFLITAGMFGAITFIPLYIQGVLGETPTNSGAVQTPMMLGFMASSIIGGQLMSRTGRYKVIAVTSLAVTGFGMFLLSRMDAGGSGGLVIRNMIVVGLGMGSLMSLFTIVVQNAFPTSQMGAVTSSLQFFRSSGGTIGVAILGSAMINRFSREFSQGLSAQVRATVPPDKLESLQNPQILLSPETAARISEGFAAMGPQGQAVLQQVMVGMREALVLAIQEVYFIGLLLVIVAFVTSLFLKEIPLRTSHHDPEHGDEGTKQAKPAPEPATSQHDENTRPISPAREEGRVWPS